jgi:carboxyl-terminal processing protease
MHQDLQQSPRQWSIWLPLLFALVLVAGILIGMKMDAGSSSVVLEESASDGASASGQGKVEELIRYIEAKYVDEVDRDKLVDEAIQSIINQLDPHSNYINAERVQEYNERLQGNYDGIGIEYIILDDTIVVFKPLEDGPSARAGVLAGDRIITVGDSLVSGVNIDHDRIRRLLRGESGEKVDLGILRKDRKELLHVEVSRGKIPLESVETSQMLDQKTGYIKITDFSSTTYEEFMKNVEELCEKKQMKNLVIDLRQNPGGYLQQATSILSQLFPEKDKLLVYTEGRATYRNDYESSGRAFYNISDVAVLIDEMSASASEILAGAIQDHDRGIIIGRRSFGKGLVQEQYNLRDGSALRLTVARYYTPSGRSIQKSYKNDRAYDNDFWERYRHGELNSEKHIAIADSTRYFTSKGRVVYGGGGIIPDIFVPLDTALLNKEYYGLQSLVKQFAFHYLEDHPGDFDDYTSGKFIKTFKIDDQMWASYRDYVAEHGESLRKDYPAVVEWEAKRYIKARMAKQLFGEEAYYGVLAQEDPMIEEALQVLSRSNPLSVLQE